MTRQSQLAPLRMQLMLKVLRVARHCSYHSVAFFRGLTLKGCEDIDDAAVILLSKYTAVQSTLPDEFNSLHLTAADPGPAAAPEATAPSDWRTVSMQRAYLSNIMVGLRQSEAPNNPHTHLQPGLNADGMADHAHSHQQHHRQSAAGTKCKIRKSCRLVKCIVVSMMIT